MRSRKLKMKVLRGPAGRNITPVKNGVVPRLENISESSGSVSKMKQIFILTFSSLTLPSTRQKSNFVLLLL